MRRLVHVATTCLLVTCFLLFAFEVVGVANGAGVSVDESECVLNRTALGCWQGTDYGETTAYMDVDALYQACADYAPCAQTFMALGPEMITREGFARMLLRHSDSVAPHIALMCDRGHACDTYRFKQHALLLHYSWLESWDRTCPHGMLLKLDAGGSGSWKCDCFADHVCHLEGEQQTALIVGLVALFIIAFIPLGKVCFGKDGDGDGDGDNDGRCGCRQPQPLASKQIAPHCVTCHHRLWCTYCEKWAT